MDNEIFYTEETKNEQIRRIRRQIEENIPVSFQISKIYDDCFIVRIGRLSATVPFRYMPWEYTSNLWEVIFPSLRGKYFKGYVYFIRRNPLRVYIKADASQFEPFQYEIDKTYTAIILRKTNTSLLVDFGYGFDWRYGSLKLRISYPHKEKDIDWFPNYDVGGEFNAVYLGKSVTENDIFAYDNTYYSIEHQSIGRKIWVNLEKTESDIFRCRSESQHIGKLLLDKKEDLGLPYEYLQKILQTLPNGQRLWCEVTNVTSDGTLQLKWLIDAIIPIEEALSIHSDASVLSVDDPLLPKEKKALINKTVWCESCDETEPRKFKIENQYFGTISLDANLYPDISLVKLLNAIDKIPDNQQIFCKIKGIYPDGTFKLQWLVQWDSSAEKLVYPNKFPQIINLETSPQEQKQALERRKILIKIGKQQYKEREEYLGEMIWIVKQKSADGKPAFLIDDKHVAKIVVNEENYPNHSCKAIKKALYKIPNGEKLFCKVLAVFKNSIGLRWMIEEDPLAERFQFTSDEIEEDENMPHIGELLWLTAQRNDKNELFFIVNDKYTGKIIPDETNYDEACRDFVKETLHKIHSEQVLLCSVQRILPQYRVELRWMIEDDPFAEQLQRIYNAEKIALGEIPKEAFTKIQEKEENSTVHANEQKGKNTNLALQKESILPANFVIGNEEATIPIVKKESKIAMPEKPVLKIVGKIDLDAINEKRKPKKKSKEDLRKEQNERIRLEKEKRDAFKEKRRAKRKAEREEKIIERIPIHTEQKIMTAEQGKTDEKHINVEKAPLSKQNKPTKRRKVFSILKNWLDRFY